MSNPDFIGEPPITLTAHQPNYLPWLGLFHKIHLANLYCVFDVAQYARKEFVNRNKIKTDTGSLWLSVPVHSKDHFQKRICDIEIVQSGWQQKHLRSISLAYAKAQYRDLYFDQLEAILLKNHRFLADLNIDILRACLNWLGIEIKIVRASDYSFQGHKSDLVLDMCVQLGACDYIFGAQGQTYADVAAFEQAGIRVYFQDYKHPVYKQCHGEFTPYLSVLDLLMNEGPNSREILLQHNRVVGE